jgi:glycosyltransferase involved in cell wall biosynthesis
VAATWLTVVMPSRCGEQWIDTSLKSLAGESAADIEVIVIDSSPTSATRDIACNYAHSLRLRVLERCDLASWQDKTNLGVKLASSEHICWLGVDDVWLPGRVAAIRSWIASAPAAPLHLAPSAIIDKAGHNLGLWRCPLPARAALGSNFVLSRLLVQNFVAAPAPVFRKDAWLACGGLDANLWYTADWDIWLKLAALGPVSYHDDVTVGFRIHENSLTVTGSRNGADFVRQMNIVLDRHLVNFDGRSKPLERIARASIDVNGALALAQTGNFRGLLRAAWQVLRLGPTGIYRYFRDSRIVERLLPRVRAKLSAALSV